MGPPAMMAKIIEPLAPIPARVMDLDAEPSDRARGSGGGCPATSQFNDRLGCARVTGVP
jgi:hypothetical protein